MKAYEEINRTPSQRELFKFGFRYRLHRKNLPAKPDIVLPKYRTVIFVNGCFWHSHEHCPGARLPKSRREYWEPKLSRNATRDKLNYAKLEKLGWRVLIVWECEIKANINSVVDKIITMLR